MPKNIYVIDTSSLIELSQRYPIDIFPGLWRNLSDLARSGCLIAPLEVFNEIGEWNKKLFQWSREHKTIFRNLDDAQLQRVREISQRFPALVDATKEKPDADPFVIALALAEQSRKEQHLFPTEYIVVTEERSTGGRRKVKIPDACNHYAIESIGLVELFRREGWTF